MDHPTLIATCPLEPSSPYTKSLPDPMPLYLTYLDLEHIVYVLDIVFTHPLSNLFLPSVVELSKDSA
jgi:hypothetical protein